MGSSVKFMYYEVCPGRVEGLVTYPEVPHPGTLPGASSWTTMLARCAEHSHNMTSLETYAYQDGRCDQRVTCDCDAGYEENGRQCVGKLKILLKVLSLQFLPPCYGGVLRTECMGILFWPLCSSIIELARNSHKFSTFQESFWIYNNYLLTSDLSFSISRCDYSLQILFVCFLALPSLLHPSIFFHICIFVDYRIQGKKVQHKLDGSVHYIMYFFSSHT